MSLSIHHNGHCVRFMSALGSGPQEHIYQIIITAHQVGTVLLKVKFLIDFVKINAR